MDEWRDRQFLKRLEEGRLRGDMMVPGYELRLGTLMRWTPDPKAADEDNNCGRMHLGENLICIRAVRSTCHGRPSVTCQVMFGNESRLWVYAHDVDWWSNEPKSAA